MKVFFSPDVIPSAWLGLKYQLTNSLITTLPQTPVPCVPQNCPIMTKLENVAFADVQEQSFTTVKTDSNIVTVNTHCTAQLWSQTVYGGTKFANTVYSGTKIVNTNNL